jgi:hypothetical protein
MELLTQNGKMKKSSKHGVTVVNWTIPAFQSKTGLKTCPNAGLCAAGCYARSGTYRFSNVARAHESKLELTLTNEFKSEMIGAIDAWLAKKSTKSLKVRIHDAGDFYSFEYMLKWFSIMNHYSTDSRVSFYTYTKQVDMFQTYRASVPKNFRLIFSFGGKQDSLIDVANDRHARVFESKTALNAAGYVDGTEDDMVAANGKSNRIGLVFHHAKNWTNTQWAKVS